MKTRIAAALLAIFPLCSSPVLAQKKAPDNRESTTTQAPAATSAPYDDRLVELSRILGSVQYLRNLCMPGEGDGWRETMETLLNTETGGEPSRRAVLTAAFNRGYRAFAATHVTCTPAAIVAEQQYRNEGATLAAEIASRFGN